MIADTREQHEQKVPMKRYGWLLLILGLPGCSGIDNALASGGWELLTMVLATIAFSLWKMNFASRSEQRDLVTAMLWYGFILVTAIVIVGFLLPARWL